MDAGYGEGTQIPHDAGRSRTGPCALGQRTVRRAQTHQRSIFRRAPAREAHRIMQLLLSRTDRMGDLILSTPAIATVRKSYPGAHITMVCSPYNSVVMERNTDVDEVVQLPREVKVSAFGKNFRNMDVAIALAPRAQDLVLVG